MDALDVYDYLRSRLGMDAERIVVFGRSMGSGPACFLAKNRPCGALILFTPFKSISALVSERVKVGSLGWDFFPNDSHLEALTIPICIIHGREDTVIPYSHAQSIYSNSLPLSPLVHMTISDNMDHNTFNMLADVVEPSVRFMERIGLKDRDGNRE